MFAVTDSATILILNELKEIKENMKHLETKLDGVVSCTPKWNVNSFSPQVWIYAVTGYSISEIGICLLLGGYVQARMQPA